MVVGTVTHKQAPFLLRVYEQMCEPKWVMAFGACATSGGFYQNYATLLGIDRIIPVDVYVPGCPPRPETVIDGIMQLQDRIARAVASDPHRNVLTVAASIFETRGRAPCARPRMRLPYAHGMLVLTLAPAELTDVVRQLKSDFGFDLLLDVTAVDWPGQQPRFERGLPLLLHRASRSGAPQDARAGRRSRRGLARRALRHPPRFMERECHDMYGIVFRGNPDLRPILLYEGFVGHPLRKDYPKEQEQPLVPYRSA